MTVHTRRQPQPPPRQPHVGAQRAPAQRAPARAPQAKPLETQGVANVEKYDAALQAAAKKYGAGPDVVAAAKAVMYQESRGKNLTLHEDGHGRGMIGLDPRGELPKFEQWAGKKFPAGTQIPGNLQAEYLVKRLQDYKTQRGSVDQAVRAWHRPGKPNDVHGDRYSQLIAGHMRQWPTPPAQPQPTQRRDAFVTTPAQRPLVALA